MRAAMMMINTVGAGGGSICFFDGARYRVGPESPAANPGPACYRRGGPLTVTDCNVMHGKLQADFFPHVFRPRPHHKLDTAIAHAKFAELSARLAEATGNPPPPTAVA